MSQESNYVIELLKNSISPVESIRNEASSKIIEFELNSNFLIILLDIATSNNNELSKLSYIILKNSICKIYSLCKINVNQTNIEYRNVLEHVKAKLLELLESSFNNGAIRLSKDFFILVRKICRHEFPGNWPELYDGMLKTLGVLSNHPDDLKLFNAVFLIHHIFKERLSMRLYRDRAITTKLVEQLFPYVSKFWALEYLGKWKALESSEKLFVNFNDVQLGTSVYLDTLTLNFYSDFLKNAFKSRDLLEVLMNLFYKFRILAKVNRSSWDKTGLVRKNILRIIKGVARVIERQPFTLVFVDFSVFLNEVFDVLVQPGRTDLENECVKLLIVIFTSNSMNNEKYSNAYFDQVEPVQKVQGDLSPIRQPRKSETIDVKKVAYYESYESLVSSKNLTKQSEIDDMMERQLTFCFYKVLSGRGGFVPFLDMLRSRYLKLDLESIGDWSEEEYPTDPPARNMVPCLISSININLVEVFNHVFNSLVKFEGSDFFNYDTYLQLYTLCFKELYKFHSYKHFSEILDVFTRLIDIPENECTKLLAFRISRIVNQWCKKPLLTHETKSQILTFLLKCVCSDKSESYKVQHLVPLYNLYKNTMDENMWTELFRSVKTDYLISHLASIVKVNVPIIRTRNIELICNICLEYEEDGHNLNLIVSLYNELKSVEICEAVVKSIHEFISKLDWVNCYTGVDSLNRNFVVFVLNIIDSNVELNAKEGLRIVSLSRYSLISELFLSMWLSFLRTTPLKLDEHLNQYFNIFGPLLDHVHGQENLKEDTVYNKLCIELLSEYVFMLGTHMEYNNDYVIENVGERVLFKSTYTCFDLVKLYKMIALLNDCTPLVVGVFYAFGLTPSVTNQCLAAIDRFFKSVEECAHSHQQASYFASLTGSDKATSFQPMRFKKELLSNVVELMPVVNKVMFTNQTLADYIRNRNGSNPEVWINEVLLTLVNVANVLRSDPFLQLGCVILCCYIISALPGSVYAFMRVERRLDAFDALELGWDNVNIHENRHGIFVMCYLLRIVSNVARNYRIKHVLISTEKVEGHAIPPSNRFEYVKNKALTNSKCLEHTNLFQKCQINL
ncbi:uncharacterized protein TOT_010000865 [Theileria orientalis strain Shintoku]|uniref:Importin N-terminal domain-containing protein n=1 Tax=Theileria orientalis strain Shintoku TaxID=869250 RepID=J4DNR3_THEOR|nr:uncharacterized protein TOT_010000865 [Theileria orientalis strain Shintoku]BAM39409.1 uncharacterized protein TOT_010000865 [Theileria orientalis strain Shintoku]|eukprot:XP_009689710.1 uncharacterized protein TOT_010000865 [Theileria orientalis strain Shintoku]